MTLNNNDLLELLDQAQKDNFYQAVLRTALEKLMDQDVSNQINAGLSERCVSRESYRNGYRTRELHTRLGQISLDIPKIRKGSYFPSFLCQYQRTEKALLSVIQESYIQGVSTRKMEKIIQQMGIEGIRKSQVSEICSTIKEEVDTYFNAPISGQWPYIYLDASYVKVRENKRVVSKAVIVAIGVNHEGSRRILGLKIVQSEATVFWEDFINSLIERGLKGVKLVISDAHKGLKEAIDKSLLGACWQRCWVHFMRNLLCHTSKKGAEEVLPNLKSITAFKEKDARREQYKKVIDLLIEKHPKIASLLIEVEEDVLAHTDFPEQHWQKIYSNNPIERLNREIKRRTNCVGIFPNDHAAVRLIGSILIHWDETWLDARTYLAPESMRELLEEGY